MKATCATERYLKMFALTDAANQPAMRLFRLMDGERQDTSEALFRVQIRKVT